MLAHMVFFTLKDKSQEAIDRLCESAREHLSGHPGTVFFAVGTRTPDLDRDVNDREFDVALQLVFQTRQDQDTYQAAPRHQSFIDANKDNWAKVRVFDSDVSD